MIDPLTLAALAALAVAVLRPKAPEGPAPLREDEAPPPADVLAERAAAERRAAVDRVAGRGPARAPRPPPPESTLPPKGSMRRARYDARTRGSASPIDRSEND